MPDYRALINRAIQNNLTLTIRYRNRMGEVREHEIQPLKWKNQWLFEARLLNTDSTLTFNINNILACREDGGQFVMSPNSKDSPPSAKSPAAMETTRTYGSTARPLRVARKTTAADSPTPAPQVNAITSPESWGALVTYLRNCLVRENLQQFVIENHDNIVPLPTDERHEWLEVYHGRKAWEVPQLAFLGGRQGDEPQGQLPYVQFINEKVQNRRQLCLGQHFLVLDHNKIVPLLYVPLSVERKERIVEKDSIVASRPFYLLSPESLEVSYAALKEMGLSEEEIEAFLAELEPLGGDYDAVEQAVLNKIAELLDFEPPQVDTEIIAGTIYRGLSLFAVSDSSATINLLLELSDLAKTGEWAKIPEALRLLLNSVPAHTLAADDAPHQDDLFVTPLYPNQIQALHAARSEPVLVVTGPPGTGKSQLVLNLLVDAFLRGERVLFASRNNQAVNVVMNRLTETLKFPGAVRVGNRQYLREAVQRMRQALNEIGTTATQSPPRLKDEVDATWVACRAALDDMRADEENLKTVRDLKGRLASYREERALYLRRLPPDLQALFDPAQPLPRLPRRDAEDLERELSDLLITALRLAEQQQTLKSHLAVRLEFTPPEESPIPQHPLVAALHAARQYHGESTAWLDLAPTPEPLAQERTLVQHWLNLIGRIEAEGQISALTRTLNDLQQEQQKAWSRLHHIGDDETPARLESLPAEVIQRIETTAAATLTLATDAVEGRMPWWWRLVNRLSGNGLIKRAGRALAQVLAPLPLPALTAALPTLTPDDLRTWAEDALTWAHLARLTQQIHQTQAALAAAQAETEHYRAALPAAGEALLADLAGVFDPYQPTGLRFDPTPLKQDLTAALATLDQLQAALTRLAEQLNDLIGRNRRGLVALKQLAASPACAVSRLWRFDGFEHPQDAVQAVQDWLNFLRAWDVESLCRDDQAKLEQLGEEEHIIQRLSATQERLFTLSQQVLRAVWLKQVCDLPNEVIKQVSQYVTALETLNDPDLQPFEINRRELRAIVHSHFEAAQRVFPIWATTNLSARQSIPLEGALFDLVVIDEASQCDIASALPLLFRAKRIAIIGDPQQLRHVATIQANVHQDVAQKIGIDLSAYNYLKQSLYDLAERSIGTQPGVILLNEHYRSDERIITFSNQNFYQERLQIKTDLRRRYRDPEFTVRWGGVYWLDVPAGDLMHRGSSWGNPTESEAVFQLIARIRERLQTRGLERDISLGVVTPFRLQADHLQNYLQTLDGAITVGTAHTFQGDEKDIILFSTVIGPGIEEGTLNWLHNTENLLNVAVTRARLALFVIGDYEFCARALPEAHPFRKLADYVHQRGRVHRDPAALLEAHTPFEIVGLRTDPSDPETTRATLRRFLTSCQDYIDWMDPYFNDRVFDLLLDVFQEGAPRVRSVRLLTAREQTQPRDPHPPQITPEKYATTRAALAHKGVWLEFRLLGRRDMPHDRFFYSVGRAVNMPPFDAAYGKHIRLSEYTLSTTDRSLFETYWQQAEEISRP
ncbi:AAA domain-containing protein [Thermanaerothrix sp.]|uniref:DEAD/DEAH box helicase n=1 Tax=Thermanaerothrix sp. TaxID=2972675 RepID=UPI003C7A4DDC